MDHSALDKLPKGCRSIPSDLNSDQTAFKGVNNRVPLFKLVASPSADTITDNFWPFFIKGPSSAVTITEATFLGLKRGPDTPNLPNRLVNVCRVNPLLLSPVFLSPTTIP